MEARLEIIIKIRNYNNYKLILLLFFLHLSIGSLNSDLFVVLLEGLEIISCLWKLSFLIDLGRIIFDVWTSMQISFSTNFNIIPYLTLFSPPKRPTFSQIREGIDRGEFYFSENFQNFTTFLSKEQLESCLIITASSLKKKNKKIRRSSLQ